MLVSKVLQNLANGVVFGEKEAHMVILNPFLYENFAYVHFFFDRLTVRFPPIHPPPAPLCYLAL